MRKYFILSVFVLTAFQMAKAQNQPVVAVEKMNILYAGVDNLVSVAIPGIITHNLQLKSNTANIIKFDDAHFAVHPQETSLSTEVVIFSLNGVDTTYYGSFVFKVIPAPDPIPCLGMIDLTQEDCQISKAQIRANPVLLFRYPDSFPLEVTPPNVIGFEIKFLSNTQNSSIKIFGSRLSDEAIIKIMAEKAGSKILLSGIQINQQGKIRKTESYEITLK